MRLRSRVLDSELGIAHQPCRVVIHDYLSRAGPPHVFRWLANTSSICTTHNPYGPRIETRPTVLRLSCELRPTVGAVSASSDDGSLVSSLIQYPGVLTCLIQRKMGQAVCHYVGSRALFVNVPCGQTQGKKARITPLLPQIFNRPQYLDCVFHRQANAGLQMPGN